MIEKVINQLNKKGIRFSLNGDNLRVSADFSPSEDDMAIIKDNKSFIIDYIQRRAVVLAPINEIALHQDYAVSSSQRRLWVLSKFEGASEAYNIPQVVRLEGSLQEQAFTKAYESLLTRHEVLRTVFTEDTDGNPRQRILEITDERFKVSIADYSHYSQEERESKIKAYVSEEVSRGFRLEEGPLIRCSLLKETESSYVLVLVMHHIVSDGWSMGVLHREWSEFYNAELEQRTPDLAPLGIQYKDYAAWHNAQLEAADIKNHKEYWLEQFNGDLPVLELSSDKSRPKIMTYNGASVYKELDKKETDQLKAFSQEQGGTLFMTLQTALKVLLHKYTGQEDIVIGSPIAGREHPDLEGQIGFYLGALPIRTTFSKEDTVYSLYQKIKQNTLGAYSNQVYPYDELVDALNLTRDTSRNPLFDVWLDYHSQEIESEGITFKGVSLKEYVIATTVSQTKFDITLVVQEQSEGGLGIYFEYNVDIYSEPQMAQLASHFSKVLLSLQSKATSKLSQFSVFAQEDLQKQFLHNPITTSFDKSTVIARFREWVKSHPDQPALLEGNKQLSYNELDEQSNRFAQYLIAEHGVKKSDLVGIKLERSFHMIVSVLGVLKTGSAYVPIDTDYPKERISFIEQDSGCKIVIDQEEWDAFHLQRALYSSKQLDIEITPEDAMYVIYTSGSTGNPKGCVLNYEGVSNYLDWTEEYSRGITYSEVDFFSSLSFDFTVSSLFGALSKGKALRIYGTKEDLSQQLKQIILNPESGWIKLTPAHINLIEEESLKAARKKVFVLGGEALTKEQIKHLRHNEGCRIYNEYGPTEATVGCIVKEIGEDNEPYIGQSIQNTETYLLDATHNLVPYGSIGEICIGGVGLARGYLNREELTKEKFIDNPYKPGERLYRTGDLGRWREDGNLEYLGRMDDQVKIRGYRIELGEIEQALTSHTAVAQGVVIARAIHNTSDKELIAYTTGAVTAEELKVYIKEKLPSYMVPNYYVKLESIPLTSNGKVDRKALPDPEGTGLQQGVYVAARTEIEKQLVKIWSEVLRTKQEEIGLESDFFALGGDSIKAIQIVARLRNVGYELKISDVMGSSRLQDMATKLRPLTRKIDQRPVEGKILLSPIQNAFLENAFARGTEDQKELFHQSFMLCFASGITATETKVVIEKLIAHHDVLRMRYQKTDDGSWEQYNGGLQGDYYVFEEATLPSDTNNDKANKAIFFEQQGTDLKQRIGFRKGLLVGVGLYHDKEQNESHLLFSIHHMVIDLVSWRILFEDIEILLEQYRKGKKLSLPEKTDSYRYWMEQNVAYAEGHLLDRQRKYWEDKQIQPVENISVKNPNGSNSFRLSKRVGFTLSQQETALMQQGMNGANKVETNALLLSSLSRALKEVFDVSSVRVLLEGHGREEYLEKIDISRTVGWFTSMYPFVLDGKQESVESILLLQDALGQVPDKGVGYGLLRYVSKQLLPKMEDAQVTFNYLGDFTREEKDIIASQSTFSYSEYGHGLDVHEDLERESELEVSGQSQNGCLQMSIQFSAARMDESKMQQLAQSYKAQLLTISQELSQYDKTLQLPGSFTYKGLTLEQIEELTKEYGTIEDVYRLSPMQQGLYYHAMSEPKSHAYFEQFGYGLKGDLDIAKLEQAYRTLIARHGVLRTVFRNDLAEEPLQVVLKEGIVDFRVEDLSTESEKEQQEKLQKIAQRYQDKGFDYEKENLFRLIVVNLGNSFELIWQQHHLILDGWSNAMLMGDFLNLLRSEKDLHHRVFQKSSFSKYVKWLEKHDEESAINYWKNYLDGYDSIAKVPESFREGSKNEYQRGLQNFSLTKEQSDQLNQFVVQNKYTFNNVFQSVFGFVLAKYLNLDDVVFGSVVSGRPDTLEDSMNMIGNFINTIPVRLSLNSDRTFGKQEITTVQKSFIESKDYHFSPLAVIQNQIGNRSLINHIIVFENYPSDEDGLDINQRIQVLQSNIEPFAQTGYNLSLTVFQSDCFSFECIYNASAYSPKLIKRLGNHLIKVLCELNKDFKEESRVTSFIDNEEIEKFKQLNPPPSTFNQSTVIELFKEAVYSYSDQPALVDGNKQLSYKELDEQSNRLAHYLAKEHGVTSGDVVGIKLDRSIAQVVSVLGVLKSGAAYVPIDTSYPKERIAFMEKDSCSKVIIDEEEWDQFNLQRTLYSTESPAVNVTPEDAMYVIYTSGSTGTPKGCVLNYEGVSNYLEWAKEYSRGITYSEVDFFSSLSFDFTVTSLFGALIQGKTLRIYDTKEDLSQQLNKIVLNPESGWIKLTPAHINLIDEQTLVTSRSKVFVLGGEALTEEQIKHLRKNQGCRIYNEYGPTEATVGCIVKEISEDNEPFIGTPIPNSEVYLTDSTHHLVPYCSIGEICIGGVGLARGYLNRPELTKEKFITNPYNPTQRLYRTGDLGRWREDGNLEYLGRMDDQVKIRGYRIELGEIEQAISTHPQSGQVVVIARATNTTADKELIAYTTGEATAEELKAYLKESLPSYMVPNYYVRLESIPLTSNGKVDRKALPDPEGTGLQPAGYVAPRTEIEKQLVQIWSNLFNQNQISVITNFTSLGGHSIMAIKALSLIYKHFSITLSVRDILENPLTQIAAKLDESITPKTGKKEMIL